MHVDPDGREPLRHQLAAELRAAIRAGRLRAGVRLPASRALAGQLGVSRGVVTDAYEQLTAEGFLASRQGAGTVVARVDADAAPAARPAPVPEQRSRFDFTPTSPDVTLFPRTLWARAVTRAATTAPDAAFEYQDGRGRVELREALAGHLGRVRGTACDPGDVVVCAGYHQATVLLLRPARRPRRAADRLRGPVAARPLAGRGTGRARAGARAARRRGLRADALQARARTRW